MTLQFSSKYAFLCFFWLVGVMGLGTVFSLFYPRLIDALFFVGITFFVVLFNAKVSLRTLTFVFFLLLFIASQGFVGLSMEYQSLIGLVFRILASIFVACSVPGFVDQSKYVIESILKIVVVYLGLLNLIGTNLLGDLFQSLSISSSGYSIQTIFFLFNRLPYASYDIAGVSLYRNQSIFSEPGFFACIILLYLYIVLILNDERNLARVAIPFVVLLSTFSTTGFLGLALLFFFWTLRGLSQASAARRIRLGLVACVLSIPLIYLLNFSYEYRIGGAGVHSYQYRTYDLFSGYVAAWKNPLFGLGYSPKSLSEKVLLEIGGSGDNLEYVTDFDRGNSNGLAQVASSMGILVFSIYIFLIYRQVLFRPRFAFFLIYILILSSQPIFAVYFNLMIVLSSFSVKARSPIPSVLP
jgi:ABC-type multidrug transport system fused ATPase/permease subunit